MGDVQKKIFAIGDVHGCSEELRALIRKLPLDQNSTLVFLGDYVDRGPDSKGVIDTILDLAELYDVIALQGNHEWLFSRYLANQENSVFVGDFIFNGGSATLNSYSQGAASFEIPAAHREFLNNLKLFHVTDTHFFVHAGIPPNFDFCLEKIDTKTAQQFLWIRKTFLDSDQRWPRIVVHGHTPVLSAEILPNRINLDSGCVFGRRLTAMNISSGELFTVERHQGERPTFLTQALRDGRGRAWRFEGEVEVDMHLSGKAIPFRTVNFNEFGLLVFSTPGSPSVALNLGQLVEGFVKPGGYQKFGFRGSVVRVDASGAAPRYAIKFDHLESAEEEA